MQTGKIHVAVYKPKEIMAQTEANRSTEGNKKYLRVYINYFTIHKGEGRKRWGGFGSQRNLKQTSTMAQTTGKPKLKTFTK